MYSFLKNISITVKQACFPGKASLPVKQRMQYLSETQTWRLGKLKVAFTGRKRHL